MRRIHATIFLLVLCAGVARADAPRLGPWQVCDGVSGPAAPRLSHCRPLAGGVDPQGRELWLRALVRARAPQEQAPTALYIYGAASSEAWFNSAHIGANGAPAPTAAQERPGRYAAEFPIPAALWRPDEQELVVRLSSFHAGARFEHPIGGIVIGRYPQPSNLAPLAVTFAAAGALLAALFGFGAVYAMRRTVSSLALAGMAGVAALQALVENYRSLVNYPYPFHIWRVNAIWALSGAFALLLVAFAYSRFLPQRRRTALGVAAPAVAATYLVHGFDDKSVGALMVGVCLAGAAAAFGVSRGQAGARPILAYLAAFLVVALATPSGLLDLSFFVLAASLTLPLLVVELIRLAREARDREAALTRAASRPDRLTVATPKGVILTPLSDIVAILGADDYVELRLRGGQTLLHAARLDRLEAALPASFIRVHRSAIASLAQVERLERDGSSWRLHVSEGPPLPVSRSRLPALRDALDEVAVPLRATA